MIKMENIVQPFSFTEFIMFFSSLTCFFRKYVINNGKISVISRIVVGFIGMLRFDRKSIGIRNNDPVKNDINILSSNVKSNFNR